MIHACDSSKLWPLGHPDQSHPKALHHQRGICVDSNLFNFNECCKAVLQCFIITPGPSTATETFSVSPGQIVHSCFWPTQAHHSFLILVVCRGRVECIKYATAGQLLPNRKTYLELIYLASVWTPLQQITDNNTEKPVFYCQKHKIWHHISLYLPNFQSAPYQ